MVMSAKEIIYKYSNGKLIGRPEFYSGRGNNSGDLDSDRIEMVYKGIRIEIGDEAAKAFVNTVAEMTDDASATTFLLSLYRLENSGWEFSSLNIPQSQGEALAESIQNARRRGDTSDSAVDVAATAGIFGVLSGSTRTVYPGAGLSITSQFLAKHDNEIIDSTRQKLLNEDLYESNGKTKGYHPYKL